MMSKTLLALAALTLAQPASAQVFLDGFVGRSFPQSERATITAAEARVNGTVIPARLRVDVERLRATSSTTFGARLGYWHDWVGVAVDAATLDTDVRRQTIRATANLRLDEELFGERITIDSGRDVAVSIPRVGVPTTGTVSLLGMVRLPRGGLQPYAFAGPTYLVTDTDLSGDWGLRAGAGARLALSRRFGLFAEYRHTRVDAEARAGRFEGTATGNGMTVRGDTGDIDVAFRLRSHAAVGGISFQF